MSSHLRSDMPTMLPVFLLLSCTEFLNDRFANWTLQGLLPDGNRRKAGAHAYPRVAT